MSKTHYQFFIDDKTGDIVLHDVTNHVALKVTTEVQIHLLKAVNAAMTEKVEQYKRLGGKVQR